MGWIYYCTPFLKSNLRKDIIDRKINVVAMQILLCIYHRVSKEKGSGHGPGIKWKKEKICEKSMYLGYGLRIKILYAKKKVT